MLKVYGGFDPVTADWAIAFRFEDHNHQQTHRGVVQPDGRMQYQPPTAENARASLVFSREEIDALAKYFADSGLIPPSNIETPLRAHLADAIGVRDRLMTLFERKV